MAHEIEQDVGLVEVAQHVGGEVLEDLLVLGQRQTGAMPLDHPPHLVEKDFGVERLGHEIVGADLKAAQLLGQ